jgi:hypothetical protein
MHISLTMRVAETLQLVHPIICEFPYAACITLFVHPALLGRKRIREQLLIASSQQIARFVAFSPIHIGVCKRKLHSGRAGAVPRNNHHILQAEICCARCRGSGGCGGRALRFGKHYCRDGG